MNIIKALVITGKLSVRLEGYPSTEDSLKELADLQEYVSNCDIFHAAISFGRLSEKRPFSSTAPSILNEYMEQLYNAIFTEADEIFHEKNIQEEESNEVLHTKIRTLNFSSRVLNALERANIYTVEDLVQTSPKNLKKIRNIGEGSIKEIVSVLNSLGIEIPGLTNHDNQKQKV